MFELNHFKTNGQQTFKLMLNERIKRKSFLKGALLAAVAGFGLSRWTGSLSTGKQTVKRTGTANRGEIAVKAEPRAVSQQEDIA